MLTNIGIIEQHNTAVIHILNISISGVTYDISNKHRLGYSEVQLVQVSLH
jgi:hypothetical protein